MRLNTGKLQRRTANRDKSSIKVLKRVEVSVREGYERVSWRSNLRRLIRFTLEDLAEMAHTLVHCLLFRDISNLFKTLAPGRYCCAGPGAVLLPEFVQRRA
ncbi:hypothetical protein E2C01_045679 [Portunus trituberculatus]|uniref:Uncharacterized protein n=1 Tax=Portunus trituberculatus TaxID=210409 RepID=A0A5B7G334_PORTR|nr:hypothetical protein [Portunus trituberculatus]